MTQNRTYAAAGLFVTLLLALLGLSFASAGPASAANHTVTLTGSGPSPARINIAVGDAITFTNADNLNFSHVVSSSDDGWSYGPTLLASGASATTARFPQPGTYTFNDHRNTVSADTAGAIVVTGAATPSPRPLASAPAPSSAAPVSSSSQDPRSAAAPLDPLTATTPAESPSAAPAVPPAVAPVPVTLAAVTAGPVQASTSASPDPSQSPAGPLAITGSVNNSNSQQAYGLPAALAAITIAGVVSLLIRLLLSHRVTPDPRHPDAR